MSKATKLFTNVSRRGLQPKLKFGQTSLLRMAPQSFVTVDKIPGARYVEYKVYERKLIDAHNTGSWLEGSEHYDTNDEVFDHGVKLFQSDMDLWSQNISSFVCNAPSNFDIIIETTDLTDKLTHFEVAVDTKNEQVAKQIGDCFEFKTFIKDGKLYLDVVEKQSPTNIGGKTFKWKLTEAPKERKKDKIGVLEKLGELFHKAEPISMRISVNLFPYNIGLDLETKAGSVYINGDFKGEELKVKALDGYKVKVAGDIVAPCKYVEIVGGKSNIILERVECKEAKVSTKTGDVLIDNIGKTDMSVKVEDGTIRALTYNRCKLDAQVQNGDIEVEVINNARELKLNSAKGGVRVYLPNEMNMQAKVDISGSNVQNCYNSDVFALKDPKCDTHHVGGVLVRKDQTGEQISCNICADVQVSAPAGEVVIDLLNNKMPSGVNKKSRDEYY